MYIEVLACDGVNALVCTHYFPVGTVEMELGQSGPKWLDDAGMVKAGYRLYYYKREDSTLEQDFFVRTANALIPLEVKAKNGTAKSMRTLISSEKYEDVHCGIKFTAGNIGYSDNIYSYPYFCAFLLKRYLAGADI